MVVTVRREYTAVGPYNFHARMCGTTEIGKHIRQEDNGEHNTNSAGVTKVKDTYRLDWLSRDWILRQMCPFLALFKLRYRSREPKHSII